MFDLFLILILLSINLLNWEEMYQAEKLLSFGNTPFN